MDYVLLFIVNVFFKIIEINVMLGWGVSVNKFDMCNLINKLFNILSYMVYCFRVSISDSFDNL